LTIQQLGIGFTLWRENKRRDRLLATGELHMEKFYDENNEEIDPTFLDITDVSSQYFVLPFQLCWLPHDMTKLMFLFVLQRKNLAYRYPL
jgi:hypothetical protein